MRWGNITLICGWALLVLGAGMLIYGIISGETFGIARGISALIFSSIFIPWGKKLKSKEQFGHSNAQPIISDKLTTASEKQLKLHDGYTVRDGYINFYDSHDLERPSGNHYKVEESKVAYYENLCETYRKNFMQIGWLRLHMPISPNQEKLGTNFLSVPERHRPRIVEMLGKETLITVDNFKTFCLVESGKRFPFEELLRNEELVDIFLLGKNNREKLDNGSITQEEYDKQLKIIEVIQKEKFHVETFTVEGMFVEG
jgi:hypothetical protein